MQAPKLSARVRKGGYGDAGGLAANGELPAAAPLALESEGELRDEVDRIALSLGPASEWVERVNGLLRVEGLVLGGAAEQFPHAFPEALALLRDPLARQLQERRSAVSRQACHALTLLALACGPRVEGLAGALVPSLFKAMAMGIQVVTDAADACARAILRHCQPRGLVPRLAEAAAHERQGRLRQCAAEYLLLILGEWDGQAYARHLPAVEAAVLSMVADAQGETRATGREAFGALAHTWQDSARGMLHRVDRGMQEKLERAAEDYVPGGHHHAQLSRQASVDTTASSSGSGATTPTGAAAAGHGAFGNTGRLGGALRVAPVPRLMLHSVGGQAEGAGAGASFGSFHSSRLTGVAATPAARVPSSARENSRPNAACPPTYLAKPSGDAPARDTYGAEDRPRQRSRKSMGGAALRVAMAAARQDQDEEEAGALRMPRPATAMSSEEGQGGSEAGAPDGGGAEGNFSGFWSEPSGPSVSVLALLAGLGRAGVDWRQKMDLFQQLGEAASQAGAHHAGEVAANVERVSAALLDGIGDAHFKVATSALVALHAALSGPGGRSFEPQLDRIVPALFARVTDAKEQVRQLVTAALDPLPAQHPPEVVLAALGKALHSNKAPRVKCAIMDFFASWAAGGGLPDGQGGGAAAEEHLPTARGQGQRALVTGVMALTTDKNPDIRRSAVAAAAAAYRAGDAGVVLAALHALPAERMAAAQKALVAAVGARDAVAAAAAPPRPGPAPSASVASERAPPAAAVEDTAASLQQPEVQPAPEQAEAAPAPQAEPASQAPSTPTHAAPVAEAGGSAVGGRLAHLGSVTLTGSPKVERVSSPLARTRSPVQFTPSSGGRRPSAAAAAAVAAPTPEPPSPFVYWANNGTPLTIRMPAAAEAAPGTPSSPSGDGVLGAQLRGLVSRLGGDAGADVFAGLSHLAAVLPTSAWPGYFSQVIAAIAESSASGSAAVREAALLLGRDLAAGVEPVLLAGSALGTLLPHLLRCAGDGDRSVALAAEEALVAVMGRVDPLACLGPLQQQLPAAGASLPTEPASVAALRAAIVGLRCALPRLAPAKLLPAVQTGLLPRLFATYDSPAADVRKATVDCLAAIWVVLGEAMAPLLEPLTPAQLKLVAIYRDRISAAALM